MVAHGNPIWFCHRRQGMVAAFEGKTVYEHISGLQLPWTPLVITGSSSSPHPSMSPDEQVALSGKDALMPSVEFYYGAQVIGVVRELAQSLQQAC